MSTAEAGGTYRRRRGRDSPRCASRSANEWGTRWLDVAPEHLDPYLALWSMCKNLAVERLPERRVVVRFDFPRQPKETSRFWLLIEHQHGEVCATCPGEEDLIITANTERFVRWQMGQLTWAQAAADDALLIDRQASEIEFRVTRAAQSSYLNDTFTLAR